MSPEFPNLSSRWATLTPTGVKASNYNPTLTPPPCPEFTSSVWEVDAKSELPTIGQTYKVQQSGSTTRSGASGASGSPTGKPSASGSAAPEKGTASTVSAWGLQGMGVGFVAMVAGLCIWL